MQKQTQLWAVILFKKKRICQTEHHNPVASVHKMKYSWKLTEAFVILQGKILADKAAANTQDDLMHMLDHITG